MAKRKENAGSPAQLVKEYRGTKPGEVYGRTEDVTGVFQVFEGKLPSGIPYRCETFQPDRTPEQQARFEKETRAAMRHFAKDYIERNGYEAAREKLSAE